MVALGIGRRSASHERRTDQMRLLLAPHLSGLGADADAIFGVICYLRTEFGLSGEEAGRVVAGVVASVLDARVE